MKPPLTLKIFILMYSMFPEYLIIYGDKNYSARQCYGEILLKYYHIKNMKKEYIFDDGEWYYKVKDNSEEEVAFLRSLTDEFVLADFNFFYIDDNSSKTEKVEFYDIAEDMYKEDSIGSSAGVLMGINATDFINFLKRAREIHGDKYDYSKVEYINNRTKICIICPEHGEFWQTPHDHLDKCKCPKCNLDIFRLESAGLN